MMMHPMMQPPMMHPGVLPMAGMPGMMPGTMPGMMLPMQPAMQPVMMHGPVQMQPMGTPYMQYFQHPHDMDCFYEDDEIDNLTTSII